VALLWRHYWSCRPARPVWGHLRAWGLHQHLPHCWSWPKKVYNPSLTHDTLKSMNMHGPHNCVHYNENGNRVAAPTSCCTTSWLAPCSWMDFNRTSSWASLPWFKQEGENLDQSSRVNEHFSCYTLLWNQIEVLQTINQLLLVCQEIDRTPASLQGWFTRDYPAGQSTYSSKRDTSVKSYMAGYYCTHKSNKLGL